MWADDVRALDEGKNPSTIRPAKGIHITVPWSLVRNEIAVVIPVPKDRRSVFVVPWGGEGGPHRFTYIGTTDTDYEGPLDEPQITRDDVAYLLRAINGAITTTITEADILGTWAGLRPLVAAAKSERTADLSRRHSVERLRLGVVTVTGGKLTTYRRMAADAIDEVVSLLGQRRTQPHQARQAPRRRRVGRQPTSRLALGERFGADAARGRPHRAVRFGMGAAADRRAAVHPRRGAVGGAIGDGAHASTTCSPAERGLGCSPATHRPAPPKTSRR